MKTKLILIHFFAIGTWLLAACSISENGKTFEIHQDAETYQVIQFHSEHRCFTCNKIESLTIETLKNFPEISFELVNVDDRDNESMADFFEASGTAVFLFNTQTGQKKDLTDFAFMSAGNEAEYKAGLQKEIKDFFQ